MVSGKRFFYGGGCQTSGGEGYVVWGGLFTKGDLHRPDLGMGRGVHGLKRQGGPVF